MKQPLWMAPSEPRCTGRACTIGKPCARKDIQDGIRRPLADFSVPAAAHVPDCSAPTWRKFVSHADAVRPQVKPQAKEWIGQ